MNHLVKQIFDGEHIDTVAVLPLSACTVTLPRLIRNPDRVQTVLLFALPYYAGDTPSRNLSLYAVPRDYHLCFSTVLPSLLAGLRAAFPDAVFEGFADHSPIDERMAAVRGGLGILGDNGLLITERYGSFVFLAEILTDLSPQAFGARGELYPVRTCEHCGACQRACPMRDNPFGVTECLSAVTQKKRLTDEKEIAYIRRYGSAWGCDLCQLSCPHNKRVIEAGMRSPLPFFSEQLCFHIDRAQIAAMPDGQFTERAFAWRGRVPILRNLAILEEAKENEN